MRSPYGLKIIESCLTCPLRQDRVFCDLSPAAIKELNAITSPATYPKGALLFVEGQAPRGLFVVCSGRVKLSTSSSEGKTIILRIAEPGDLVGLPSTISGEPYEVSAEVLEPTQANFIPRDSFLQFLTAHGEAALRVAQILGGIYHSAYQGVRSLGLAQSSAEKLARFLLEWSDKHAGNRGKAEVRLTLTHEEIAQAIGASRETVTRLLGDFRKKRLIQVKGSTLVLRDRSGLENLALQ